MVGGALVAGAVVGAGSMYMWNRMDRYESYSYSRRRTMQERLQASGARSADITITLMWDTTDDLNLQVRVPGGELINHQRRRAGGGWLDHDANSGMVGRDDPVENVMFDYPQEGRYEVSVRYDDCTGLCGDVIPFEIMVRAAVVLSASQYAAGVRVLDQSDYGTILQYNGEFTQSGQSDGILAFTVAPGGVPRREWCIGPAGTTRAGSLMDCSECELMVSNAAAGWDSLPTQMPRVSSGPGRRLETCIPCAGAQCDVQLPAPMNRDDLMQAMIIPARVTAPLMININSLSGLSADGYCTIPPTASANMMVSLTTLDMLPNDDGSEACDAFLNVGCVAQSPTRCYNNEICVMNKCECEPGACLNGNECVLQDIPVDGSSSGSVALTIGAFGARRSLVAALLALCALVSPGAAGR